MLKLVSCARLVKTRLKYSSGFCRWKLLYPMLALSSWRVFQTSTFVKLRAFSPNTISEVCPFSCSFSVRLLTSHHSAWSTSRQSSLGTMRKCPGGFSVSPALLTMKLQCQFLDKRKHTPIHHTLADGILAHFSPSKKHPNNSPANLHLFSRLLHWKSLAPAYEFILTFLQKTKISLWIYLLLFLKMQSGALFAWVRLVDWFIRMRRHLLMTRLCLELCIVYLLSFHRTPFSFTSYFYDDIIRSSNICENQRWFRKCSLLPGSTSFVAIVF